jgi:hypothetical protein
MEGTTEKLDFAMISTISIVYFTACGALWHIGYWSTFDINILQFISVGDIIKSFVFPFLSSSIVILLAYFFTNYITIADNIGKPDQYISGMGKNTKIGQYLNKNRMFFLTIYLGFIFFLYIYGNDYKWSYLPLPISIPIGIFLSHQTFFIKKIAHPDLRFFTVTFLALLPLISFGLAKQESLAIRDNKKYKIVTRIESESKNDLTYLIGYKYIGSGGNKIFLSKLDNTEIVYVNDNIILINSLETFSSTKIST